MKVVSVELYEKSYGKAYLIWRYENGIAAHEIMVNWIKRYDALKQASEKLLKESND